MHELRVFCHADATNDLLDFHLYSMKSSPDRIRGFQYPLLCVWFLGLKNQILLREGTETPIGSGRKEKYIVG